VVAASPEDRFLAWHRSGEPLPLYRAIRDHARAAKHTVAVSTAERYAVLSERSKIKRRTMERRKKEYLAQKAS